MKNTLWMWFVVLYGSTLVHAADYVVVENKTYAAGETTEVRAGQQISAALNVTLSPGADVKYTAGTQLFFGPGFSVQEGAAFRATVDATVRTHGIPEQWALDYGLNPYEANVALSDPDNDGLTNFAEYCLGSNPNVADGQAAFKALGYLEAPARWILVPGSVGPTVWHYTTTAPADLNDWKSSTFVMDNTWLTGSVGFAGDYSIVDSGVDVRRTDWGAATPELWLRNTFIVTESSDIASLVFWGRIDDTMEVYINGQLALEEKGWSSANRYYGIKDAARGAVHLGVNTIAVHAKDNGGGRYFDLGITTNAALCAMPSSGWELPGYERFGQALRQYMIEHGLPGGLIAVMKCDQLLVCRGFGWSDRRLTVPLPATAIMRLASNDKVITKGAVQCLLSSDIVRNWRGSGQALTVESPAFQNPNTSSVGALRLTAMPGYTVDPRKYNITIGHLIAHRSGLRELPAPSAFFQDVGVPYGSPTTAEDDIRWTYSVPFSPATGDVGSTPWIPGNAEIYCSVGYATLRHIVQVASGDFSSYLSDIVFSPEVMGGIVDIGSQDITIAHEQLGQRSFREPWYATLDTRGADMEYPNRRLYLENYTALAASAPAYARYLQYYGISHGTRLDVLSDGHGSGEGNGVGVASGSMAGTVSFAYQAIWDRISIVIIFNIAGSYNDIAENIFYTITPDIFDL